MQGSSLEPSYLSPHASPEARAMARHLTANQPKTDMPQGWRPTFTAGPYTVLFRVLKACFYGSNSFLLLSIQSGEAPTAPASVLMLRLPLTTRARNHSRSKPARQSRKNIRYWRKNQRFNFHLTCNLFYLTGGGAVRLPSEPLRWPHNVPWWRHKGVVQGRRELVVRWEVEWWQARVFPQQLRGIRRFVNYVFSFYCLLKCLQGNKGAMLCCFNHVFMRKFL